MAAEREWTAVGERRPVLGAWPPAFAQDVQFPCGHTEECRFRDSGPYGSDWMMDHFRQNDILCRACNAERERQRIAAAQVAQAAFMATAVYDEESRRWWQPDDLAEIQAFSRLWAEEKRAAAAEEQRLALARCERQTCAVCGGEWLGHGRGHAPVWETCGLPVYGRPAQRRRMAGAGSWCEQHIMEHYRGMLGPDMPASIPEAVAIMVRRAAERENRGCDLCREPGEWVSGAGMVLCYRHEDSY